jgi:small subunit ribosomal protein S16
MVVIRLSRSGAKKRPFYHIVVADKARSRDGRFIEQLGYYNPIASGQAVPLSLDLEKAQEWIKKGAQPSDRVKSLIKMAEKAPKTEESAA